MKKNRKALTATLDEIGAKIPEGQESAVLEILTEYTREDDTLLRLGMNSMMLLKDSGEEIMERLFSFCCQDNEGAEELFAIIMAVSSELIAKAGDNGIKIFLDRVKERMQSYDGSDVPLVVTPNKMMS